MNNPVTKIVVVGGGTAGWMAAAALSHYITYPGTRITLVESEQIGTVGVGEATIPGIRDFNRRLGIDESEFMSATQATFKLGIEFINWGRRGDRYLHPFGFYGHDLQALSFYHYWLRARQNGFETPFEAFNPACALAESGNFQLPNQDPKSLASRYFYAFHLDAGRYAAFLRKRSEAAGVKRIEGKVAQIHKNANNGFLESLTLESGETIEGDLFLDCSGFRSILLGQELGIKYVSWKHWLPCDRAYAVQGSSAQPLHPKTQAFAHQAGWRWRIPLQERTGNGTVYSSEFLADELALEELLTAIDGATQSEPNHIRFEAGMRETVWYKNCVAIGLSSGFLEPLESTSIHLIQTAVMKLINLFPDTGFSASKTAEFNKQMNSQFEQVRDFLIMHYKLNQREDSDFWRYCQNMSIPASLEERLGMYLDTGQLTNCDNETFVETNWIAVLFGQNYLPNTYNRRADSLAPERLQALMAQMEATVRAFVSNSPSHGEFVRSYCTAV